MVSAWRNFKNIFSRPLFTIIFRPEMLKFHTYSIFTGDTMVGFVIFCVLKTYQIATADCQYFLYGNWKNRRRQRHNWNSSYKIFILAQWVQFLYEKPFLFLILSMFSPDINPAEFSETMSWLIGFEVFSMTLLFTNIYMSKMLIVRLNILPKLFSEI